MTYQYITAHSSPNYTPASRCAAVFGVSRRVTSITIHWWDDPKRRPTFESVVSYLCRKGGSSSAHYVAEHGRVACIVDPDNAAWHAGNGYGNATSVGIECAPYATDADYQTVAELIADLREKYGDVPLRRHSSWKATACPGVWDLARLDRLAREIAKGRTKPSNPGVDPKPKPPRPTKPKTRRPKKRPTLRYGSKGNEVRLWQRILRADGYSIGRAGVDGDYGAATQTATRKWQAAHGLTPDGVAGPRTWARSLRGTADGVLRHGDTGPHVEALQAIVGASRDGVFGPATEVRTEQVQRYLGVVPDGVIGSKSTNALVAHWT